MANKEKNKKASVWIPFEGQRVTIQIDGMEQPQVGTITWHGMVDADWGGFSVTLDEKHPRYTKTIGPYRADYFRTIASPITQD